MVTHVAIVPFSDPEADGPPSIQKELLQVTAALQAQVAGDFARFWDVSAVVSAFESLADVPPHYIPIAITQDDLPGHRRAFHFTLGGSPFALVRYEEDWSLGASHELLEILCDPTGQVTARGPSLLDRQRQEWEENDTPQGDVDYLVEICDACETSTYKIDGVLVSDFVTPRFYDAVEVEGERYSFTGTIKAPLTLLEGGYISWRTRLPDPEIFQAEAVPPKGAMKTVVEKAKRSEPQTPWTVANLTIGSVTPTPAKFSRDWMDSLATPFKFPDSGKPPAYKPPSKQWAEAFYKDVNAVVKLMELPRQASLDDVISYVQYMTDKDNNKKYGEIPVADRGPELAKEWKIHGTKPSENVPNADEFTERLRLLKNLKATLGLFDPSLLDPDFALWMCMLTN
jgi:hypothetical protein